MTPKHPRLTAREVESILSRNGFELVSQRGSHRKWRHSAKGVQVIVPEHKGKMIPIGTLRSILKGAEIDEEDWL